MTFSINAEVHLTVKHQIIFKTFSGIQIELSQSDMDHFMSNLELSSYI